MGGGKDIKIPGSLGPVSWRMQWKTTDPVSSKVEDQDSTSLPFDLQMHICVYTFTHDMI